MNQPLFIQPQKPKLPRHKAQLKIIRQMLKARLHCGHAMQEVHPKMQPYLFTDKHGRHLIDIGYSFRCLHKARKVVRHVARIQGQCLLVGTHPTRAEYLTRFAKNIKCHYVTQKWLGGMLTNWMTLQRRLACLTELERQVSAGTLRAIPKQEASILNKKLIKLRKYLKGLQYMTTLPDVVIVIGQNRERTAIQECQKLAIPVIAPVDSNCDPHLVDLPIPANDDSVLALRYMLRFLVAPILKQRRQTYHALRRKTSSGRASNRI